MSLVGKIFTVLILIMSVAFLMLAVTIFATHRNWREAVVRDRTAEGGPGLKIQIEDLTDTNRRLREEIERASDRLAIEQAARRYALAALQTTLEQKQQQLSQREKEYQDLLAAHGVRINEMEANLAALTAIMEENGDLRIAYRDSQQARDEKFDEVLNLTDKLNALHGTWSNLKEREKQLVESVSRMSVVLERHELDEFTPVVDIPPKVDGIVTAVGEKDLVEISIGSDDGLREGHTLEVFRNNAYLGRVKVVRTEPDRAVVEILKAYRQGIIKKGDRVATKLS